MAGLLESLGPLASLVEATADPVGTCNVLIEGAGTGDAASLARVFRQVGLAVAALRYAGVLGESGELTPVAQARLLQLEVMVRMRMESEDSWRPVVTVPPFLRKAIPEGRMPETILVLHQLISTARRRIVMASPFLDEGFENICTAACSFIERGGSFLLITRELANPNSHNSGVVRDFRARCGDAPNLEIVSWEEEILGLHMKAAVADSHRAYVGSANFTWGGMGDHAELGVILEGRSVRQIEELLDVLAKELRIRKRPQAR